MFSFPAENMKEADAQTVASMANVISKIDENSYRMKMVNYQRKYGLKRISLNQVLILA